LIFLKK